MTWEEALKILGLDMASDPKQVRRAYLRRLKSCKPEFDPEGFKQLREAFELLSQGLQYDAIEDPSDLGLDLNPDSASDRPPATTHESPHAAPRENPGTVAAQLAAQRDQDWLTSLDTCHQTLRDSANPEVLERSGKGLLALARNLSAPTLEQANSTAAIIQPLVLRLYALRMPQAARELTEELTAFLHEYHLEIALTWNAHRSFENVALEELASLSRRADPGILSLLAAALLSDENPDLSEELAAFREEHPIAAQRAAESLSYSPLWSNLAPHLALSDHSDVLLIPEEARPPSFLRAFWAISYRILLISSLSGVLMKSC